MEIVLDTLTQHDTSQPTDLSGQDMYGNVYIRREVLEDAMERLNVPRYAHWGRSSVVWWRGEVGTLHIELRATRMVRVWKGYGFAWAHVQDSYDEPFTHYKLPAYIATCVHIKGKGRNAYAWSIYRLLVHLIEWERAKYG
jgi:hypothetical protein